MTTDYSRYSPRTFKFGSYAGFVCLSYLLTSVVTVLWSAVNAIVRSGCYPNCEFPFVLFAFGFGLAAALAMPVLLVVLSLGFVVWRVSISAGSGIFVSALICAALATVTFVFSVKFLPVVRGGALPDIQIGHIVRGFIRQFVFAAPVSMIMASRFFRNE